MKVFKRRIIWGGGQSLHYLLPCTDFWLVGGEVTGWCSQNLVLSLKLPSSTWEGALIPAEELKHILLCRFLEEEPGTCPMLHYCFLISPPFFLQSLPSLISNCLNLPFGTQERSRRLNEDYFLQIRNRVHGKDLYLGGPHRVLQGFTSCTSSLSLSSPSFESCPINASESWKQQQQNQ